MFNKKGFFNAIKKANKVVAQNKAQQKTKSTKEKYKSIANMQSFIDKSEEKRNLLLKVLRETKAEDVDKKILEKGVVLYVKLLEVISLIEEDFKREGISFQTIKGATTTDKRAKVVNWFNEDSSNKVLIISDAGGESINIKKTNEIVLYNIPDGYRKYTQTLGRVCRGYFEKSYVHLVQIEDSLDEYLCELISSKKELENELLHCDNIPLKSTSSFNAEVLKKIKKDKLWKC